MALLAEAAEINPPPTTRPHPDELVSFIPMAEVDAASGSTTLGSDRPFAEVSKGYTLFERGDVLVAKITPCFENGKIAHAHPQSAIAAGSSEFHVIRPRQGVSDARYLLHFLRQPRVRLAGESRMTGSAGQRRVPESFIRELQVPLPPIEEQRRIAAILDKADELRTKRRAALAQLDTLTEAIFIDMFGDPETNLRGWSDDLTLGELADIRSGVTKGRAATGRMVEVPYLAVTNVQDRHLRLDSVKTIEVTADELDRYRLQPDDLLLTEGGDPDKLGRGALWSDQIPGCIHQNHIFRVRLTTGIVRPLFLNWLIGSNRGKRYFLRSAKQTTGIASINLSQLRAFPMLVPPLVLQQEFESRVLAVAHSRAVSGLSAAKIDQLFSSLQHRAFSGAL